MLLRAIDSVRPGRLQHLRSLQEEGAGRHKAVVEVEKKTKKRRKKTRRGMSRGLGNKSKIEYREKRLESASAERHS